MPWLSIIFSKIFSVYRNSESAIVFKDSALPENAGIKLSAYLFGSIILDKGLRFSSPVLSILSSILRFINLLSFYGILIISLTTIAHYPMFNNRTVYSSERWITNLIKSSKIVWHSTAPWLIHRAVTATMEQWRRYAQRSTGSCCSQVLFPRHKRHFIPGAQIRGPSFFISLQ